MPSDLATHPLWMNGAEWLKWSATEWPSQNIKTDTNLEERPQSTTVLLTEGVVNEQIILLRRCSSLVQLQVITGLLYRFIHNCRISKSERIYGHVSVSERHDALLIWIRLVQADEFAHEIHCLKTGCGIKNSSNIISVFCESVVGCAKQTFHLMLLILQFCRRNVICRS